MKTISAIEFATNNIANKTGTKTLTASKFHELRNKEYEVLIRDGVLNDTDKNFAEFDKLLGNKLNVKWD